MNSSDREEDGRGEISEKDRGLSGGEAGEVRVKTKQKQHPEVRSIGGGAEGQGFVYLDEVRPGEGLVLPSIGRTKSFCRFTTQAEGSITRILKPARDWPMLTWR